MKKIIKSFTSMFLIISLLVSAIAMIPNENVMASETSDVFNSGSIKMVSAGYAHTAIVKTDGSLWMTGYNEYGQLGDGTTENKYSPVKVMTGVSAVSAGAYHTAILKTDGSLWMTGWNSFGQIGDGSTPVVLGGGSTTVNSGADYGHAIKSPESKTTPVKIMTEVSAVSAGARHTAILKKDGSLWMTGDNEYGQLGDGTTKDKYAPVKVMTGVSKVSAGWKHTAILKTDGSLWMTGNNFYGTFGDGTTTNRKKPVKVMTGVKDVSVGLKITAILKKDGSLWMTGYNDSGQFGDGTTVKKKKPVKVTTGVSVVNACWKHVAILKKDGSLWMTGRNRYGQLGDGTNIDTNRLIKVMSGVKLVGIGYNHTVILKKDGSLWTTGRNSYGQLGNGATKDKNTPVKIFDGRGNDLSNNKYIIKYDKNGAKGSMKNQTVKYEESVVLNKNMFTRKGYTFVGWATSKTNAKNLKVKYTDKQKVSNLSFKNNDTVTLYATWVKNATKKYKITYKLNGKGAKNSKANRTYYTVNTKTFKLNSPTRKGYKFVGWYTKKYRGTKVTKIKKGSFGNITLYAMWITNREAELQASIDKMLEGTDYIIGDDEDPWTEYFPDSDYDWD